MADDDEKTFDFLGIPIKVGTMEECRKAGYIICGRADLPSPYDDNKVGQCVICGIPVIYRPYMPEEPKKICVECFPKTVNPS